jgi:hypothetical protein
MSEVELLPFHRLADRHIGLTEPLAGAYTDAARVCLDRHHAPPIAFSVADDGRARQVRLQWDVTDERCRAAYANEIDTTEYGAYACAIAAVEITRGLFAVRRAEARSGADYYLAPDGMPLNDLERCFRLEVSGVDRGASAVVAARLEEKIEQARNGESNLPALAAVVGFKAQLILIRSLDSYELD